MPCYSLFPVPCFLGTPYPPISCETVKLLTPSRPQMRQRSEPQALRLSLARPFVAHLHSWEAKTKVEKKSRRRPNPSPSRNLRRDANHSRRPRRSKPELHASPGRSAAGKGVSSLPRRFLAPLARFGQPFRCNQLRAAVKGTHHGTASSKALALREVLRQGVYSCVGNLPQLCLPPLCF